MRLRNVVRDILMVELAKHCTYEPAGVSEDEGCLILSDSRYEAFLNKTVQRLEDEVVRKLVWREKW